MPNPLSQPDIDELIRIYRKAQEDLIRDIATLSQTNFSYTIQYKQALLAQVNYKLEVLQRQSDRWIEQNIPQAYIQGLEEANLEIQRQYRLANTAFPTFPNEFTVIHQEAILSLTNGTREKFDNLIRHTGRAADDMITQTVNRVISEGLATGQTLTQAQAAIMEALKNQGLEAFTYMRNGKTVTMQLAAYASTVARSTTAEATNQASMRQAQQVSGDLVQMTSHSTSCAFCYPYQGRVYSITGQTRGYPRLDRPFSSGYANIHPNCRHRINPYIPSLQSKKDLAKDKAYSNRPFEIPNMSDAEQDAFRRQIANYNAGQALNAKQYANRRQYERFVSRLGDQAPKSYSGFMRMKNAESESWDNLQADYRKTGAERKAEAEVQG